MPISELIRPVVDNMYYSQWASKSTVWSILQDKAGKMWFGAGDGVYCYDGFSFSCFLANKNVVNTDSLHLKNVSDMVEDASGNIWFASGMPPGYEGLIKYDGKALTRYLPQGEGWFRNIVKSKNGNLLLATRHFGVWSYNGSTFSDYPQPDQLIEGSLNAIWEDKAGELWVASDYGKDKGDTLGGLWHSKFNGHPDSSAPFYNVFNKEVYFLMGDKAGNIWFSSMGMSLFRFDGKTVVRFSEQ
jgi:ligand-binding sensor domain-containing protein